VPLKIHRASRPLGFQSLLPSATESWTRRSRSALAITDTELNVIAALAMIGLSKRPVRLSTAYVAWDPRIFVCLTSAQARIGIPMRLGPTQYATGGSELHRGRCGPLST
jgi:hypothetical protein